MTYDIKQYKTYFMVWRSEISNDDGNKSIIKSYVEGNRCGNEGRGSSLSFVFSTRFTLQVLH